MENQLYSNEADQEQLLNLEIQLLQINNSYLHRPMKHIEQKLSAIWQLKKMAAGKVLSISNENQSKVENYERFLKYLRKEAKDQKMNEFEIVSISQGIFEDLDELIRACYWQYRLQRTDFQSLFLKLKFNDQGNKRAKFNLDQVINYQVKKQKQILMNCKNNLLHEMRNQIQYFDLETLINKAHQILTSLSYFSSLGQDQSKNLRNIIEEISKNYNILPFHNFTHGFGVFLSFFCLNLQEEIKEVIDDFTLFYGLLACLSHDIQHQGNNTLFEVKTNSHMAIQFGKFTVLQKMHLAKTLQILTKKQFTNKLYESLSLENKKKARRIIAKAILATDMSKHYEYVDIIAHKQFDRVNIQDRELVVQILVHACDIENPSLDFQNYMHWAHLVCIEFHEQTVREQQWEVEVTDFLKFDSLTYFYKNQMNFANSVVLPLWQGIQIQFPKLESQEYVKKIKKNISILTDTLRRNSEPILTNRTVQQYISNQLAK